MKIPKLHLWIPAFNRFLLLSCLLLALMVLLRVADLLTIGRLPVPLPELAGHALWADLLTFFGIVRWIVLPYLLLYMFISRRAGDVFYFIVMALCVLLGLSLNLYFHETSVPLGADLFGYSVKEIEQTVGAATGSIQTGTLLTLGALLVAILVIVIVVSRREIRGDRRGFWFVLVCLAFLAVPLSRSLIGNNVRPEFASNIVLNKTGFFMTRAQQHFSGEPYSGNVSSLPPVADSLLRADYVEPDKYPFLHTSRPGSTLLPFFSVLPQRPNIVIVLVEGLGRAFSGQGAYLGSFTPFLDSLAGRSLYWENFLSAGGRTFAVLPSMTGSLPFARNGFAELAPQLPPSLTLLNLARHNGYRTRFFYAGDASFDKMDLFVKDQQVDSVIDRNSFGEGYNLLPASSSGFTWGYGDAELFRKYLAATPADTARPRLDIMLTVSTHSPFLVPDQPYYTQLAEQRLQALQLKPEQLAMQRQYLPVYASVLYMDHSLREFFRELIQRPDYANTIVLITGDHRLPEIPMRSKIDRYHTLLIAHSPLFRQPARFSSVSSHLDVPASFAPLLGETPALATWIGSGLDTAREFRNVHQYPLMQTKNDLVDFVSGTWMLNNGSLFRILPDLDLEPVTDEAALRELNAGFQRFRQKNNQFLQTGLLLPDSLYHRFTR